MKTIVLVILSVLFFQQAFTQVRDEAKYSTGSVFLVSEIEKYYEGENREAFIRLAGNFSDNPISYIEKINTDNFKADIMFVYKDYILAFDYTEDWKVVNDDYKHQFLFDYGNAALSGWFDSYNKLCELQKVRVPRGDFYMDMFYIDRYSREYPYDITMKLINTKTGAEKIYNTWDKDIHRQTFGLYTCVHPTRGLQVSFQLFPAVLRPEMKNFFSFLEQ